MPIPDQNPVYADFSPVYADFSKCFSEYHLYACIAFVSSP